MQPDRRKIAMGAIAPFTQQPLGHFVDGASVAGEGTSFPINDPSTGAVLGEARDASEAELNGAVAAAKRAFPGWAGTSGEKRKAILQSL